MAEQFRSLRNGLMYNEGKNTVKKVLVSSSVKGEGKSFIATNLAISLALTGKKTLLIDLELLRSEISSNLGLAEKPGISEFLVGSVTASSILYKSAQNDKLFIIPSGAGSLGATELIVGGKLNQLLGQMENEFDYIIICANSLMEDANTQAISHMCDRTLFVIRHGVTPKLSLNMLLQNKKLDDLHEPALVFNGVRGRGVFGSRQYGYGFGYGYNISH